MVLHTVHHVPRSHHCSRSVDTHLDVSLSSAVNSNSNQAPLTSGTVQGINRGSGSQDCTAQQKMCDIPKHPWWKSNLCKRQLEWKFKSTLTSLHHLAASGVQRGVCVSLWKGLGLLHFTEVPALETGGLLFLLMVPNNRCCVPAS